MGVRIPAKFLEEMNIHLGEEIHMEFDSRTKSITISKDGQAYKDKFESDVLDIIMKYEKSKKE